MKTECTHLIASHLEKIVDCGTANFGPDPNAMWMASLDVKSGRYPDDDTRPSHIGKRVYRQIDAPKGSTIYWDQPQLVAAHALSKLTGRQLYAAAADRYVRAFLSRSVAHKTGLFLWGNHYYYDAFVGKVMWFPGDSAPPTPIDEDSELGARHEIRPLPPAWQLFWHNAPEATENEIRACAQYHLVDETTGHFNRHADNEVSYDFLEAGGILVETFGWFYARSNDQEFANLASKVARFSFDNRNPMTHLLEQASDSQRWDKVTSTTEVGLWAGSLLRAQTYTGNPEFLDMAKEAISAYLQYGFDVKEQRYYGRINVVDGNPQLTEKVTQFQPDRYSDIWNAMYPTHDYAMGFATTCVELYAQTGEAVFEQAVKRWVKIVETDRYADRIRYAESYGRIIWFLLRSAEVFDQDAYKQLAHSIADQAIADLFVDGMFRGHTGEMRYDAVDGVGFLLLALLWLETGKKPDLMGFGF